ncbi:MAG: PilZ domain-containing protein [Acidobacteria bacterium]|nr:PilZ domain-containing protein [Acidobacteriota bacterium]
MAELLVKPPDYTAPSHELSNAQLSDYQAQLNHLFTRIEEASTHYELLGLSATATYEQILQAYQQALKILYPTYQLRIATAEKLGERMDAAFNKLSWAFSILANFKKRGDYHTFVLAKAKPSADAPTATRRKNTHSTLQAITEGRQSAEISSPAALLPLNETPTNRPRPRSKEMPLYQQNDGLGQHTVYQEFATASKDDNRRRSQRFRLSLPVRIAGFDRVGNKWNEMTQSIDVSRTGVTLKLKRRVRQNTVIYLSLPLPTKLRTHGFTDAGFNTYALVRRVEPPKNGERLVALEFIGEHPPSGFLQKPWATFRPGKWAGQERRRNIRENRVEKIRLEYFNDALVSLGSEETFTENVSPSGMRLFVKAAPFEFDIVRVKCSGRNFESLAVVRNRYIARDGTERLCLHFINSSFQPL